MTLTKNVLKGQRELKLLCGVGINRVFVGYSSAEIIFSSVSNMLLFACVINAFSSLQVEDNSVSMIFRFFREHTRLEAPRLFCLCSQPLSPHTNRHHFHSRRPTVFLWHQQTDYSVRIYQTSRGIWHLWVLFFFPILHRIHLAFSVLASPLTPLRKSLRFWLSSC